MARAAWPLRSATRPAQLDAGVVQELVQPAGFRRPHGFELAPVATDQAQFAQVLGWNEAGADQAVAAQLGQPFAVGDIGLAAGDVLDMVGVDHPDAQAGFFQ